MNTPHTPLKILFIPVSTPKGVGEYARSLILAQGVKNRFGACEIAFVLNEHAPYAESCPFPVFPCSQSPTKCSTTVCKHIDHFQPDIVIFDASGRVQQLKHAKSIGAHTIAICQHPRKLRKASSIRRLTYTDQCWWVQTQDMLPPNSIWQQLKHKITGTSVTAIGPIFHTPSQQDSEHIQSTLNLLNKPYIVVNAGGGGNMIGDVNAMDIFVSATDNLAQHTHPVYVYGPNYPGTAAEKNNSATHINKLTPEEFSALLSGARGALLGGGSALFQSVHFGIPTIAVPVSKDQRERIEALQNTTIVKAEPNLEDIRRKLEYFHKHTPASRSNKESGLGNALSCLRKVSEQRNHALISDK